METKERTFMKKAIFVLVCVCCVMSINCYGASDSNVADSNERGPSRSWKEYGSLVKIWPHLKQEKIESIRFCEAISLEYGYDLESDFQQNVNTFGFRERAADVVRSIA
jgi:hypothetical protein